MGPAFRRTLPWLVVLCGAAVTVGTADGPAGPKPPSPSYFLLHVDRDGRELLKAPLPDAPPRARAVVSGDGRVWIAGASELARYSPQGKLLWRVAVPGLARTRLDSSTVNPDGSVWSTSIDGELTPRVKVVSGDGSVWSTSNSDVVHLSASGREIWRGEGSAKGLSDLWADPRDSSCWVMYQREGKLVHLSARGKELCRKSSLGYFDLRAVSPADGSCWLSTRDSLIHLSPKGRELGRISLKGYHYPVVNTRDGSVWVATSDPAPRLVHLAPNGRVLARTAAQRAGASVEPEGVNPRNGSCWASIGSFPGVGPDGPHVGALASTFVTHFAADGRELGTSAALAFGWALYVDPPDDSCWAYSSALYHIPPDCRAPGRGAARGRRPWSPELAPGTRLPSFVDSLAVDPSDGSCWAVGYVYEDGASAPATPAVAEEAEAGVPVPELLEPVDGAVMDNGRTDGQDAIAWTFNWRSCRGADRCQIYVKCGYARYPLVDEVCFTENPNLPTVGFRKYRRGSYVTKGSGRQWSWRVRARVSGVWGEWSQERTFTVEPVNTDPPTPAPGTRAEDPTIAAVQPFTARTGYLSLPGSLRWQIWRDQQVWLTYPEAAHRIALAQDGPQGWSAPRAGALRGAGPVPQLLEPREGALLPNGRRDGPNTDVFWDFSWTECEGAEAYQLYVVGRDADYPLVNMRTLAKPSFRLPLNGYSVEDNRFDWAWTVRAKVNGIWGEWAPTRTFDVESLHVAP